MSQTIEERLLHMKPIVLNPPAYQLGQRVVTPYNESGTVCGVSYILKPSPYDWDSGWCYTIKFDNPKIDTGTSHESFVRPLEVIA